MKKYLFQDTTPRFWYWLGWWTGTSIFFCLLAAYLAGGGLDVYKLAVDWLHKWQTLVAGIIALIGAILTVNAVRHQIQSTHNQEEDRRERKQYADRVAMPSALAELMTYSVDCLTVQKALEQFKTPVVGPLSVHPKKLAEQIPPYPSEQISVLRVSLETTDKDKREPIAEIIRRLQIQHYRLTRMVSDAVPGTGRIITAENIADNMVDSIELIARSNLTIPYARGLQPAPPEQISRREMERAADFHSVDKDEHPLVYERIRARFQNG